MTEAEQTALMYNSPTHIAAIINLRLHLHEQLTQKFR